jgi:hypothetical protein
VEIDRPFVAIERSMKRAIAALKDAGIPFLLGGSLSAWARGGPEVHNDLDFVVKPEDAERAQQALTAIGMRPERPPEDWLLKAHDGEVTVDLIFAPSGVEVTDGLIEEAEQLEVGAMRIGVLSPEDLMCSKLLALHEHELDYESSLQIARSLREQIDWSEVQRRTGESPYARAFLALVEELGLVDRLDRRPAAHRGALTRAEVHPVPDPDEALPRAVG